MPALLQKYKVPGAVVSGITNGEVAWTMAFGRANLSTGAPMLPDMIFNHGSNGKVLTAWGILRLVEQGKVELDAPANRYLKRWQIRSTQFDPDGVTIRRMLTHRAGLSVHGFLDYDQRRRLPTLVEILEGKNQIELFGNLNGPVIIKWKPGSTEVYSGGGFVLLQMVIEDVTGESFAAFMHREVTAPLGLGGLEWAWTPRLEAAAPMPYGDLQEPVGYRQLGCQAIGSELCSVPDFARFVAAAVTGPHGEPGGRGVLKPETIAKMREAYPSGLGYEFSLRNLTRGEIAPNPDHVVRMMDHFGANPGWNAHFLLDVGRRKGLVVANNSSGGLPFNIAVQKLWFTATLGAETHSDPPNDYINPEDEPEPGEGITVRANDLACKIAVGLWVVLLLPAAWCARQIARGKRHRHWPPTKRRLLILLPPVIVFLCWWYIFYAPQSFPLPFGPSLPSAWKLPCIHYVTALLLGWIGVALLFALCPRRPRPTASSAAAATSLSSTGGEGRGEGVGNPIS